MRLSRGNRPDFVLYLYPDFILHTIRYEVKAINTAIYSIF